MNEVEQEAMQEEALDVAYLKAAWEEAMLDDSPGEPIEPLFEELRKKYRAMAKAQEHSRR